MMAKWHTPPYKTTIAEQARAAGVSVAVLKRRLADQAKKRLDELRRCGHVIKDGKLVPDPELEKQRLIEILQQKNNRKRL